MAQRVGRNGVISARAYVGAQVLAKVLGLGFLLLAAQATSKGQLGKLLAGVLMAGLLMLTVEFGRASHSLRVLSLDRDDPDGRRLARRRLLLMWAPGLAVALPSLVMDRSTLTYYGLVLALGLIMAGNSVAEAVLLALNRGGRAGVANLVFNASACVSVGALVIVGHSGDLSADTLLATYFLAATAAAMTHAGALRSERLLARQSDHVGSAEMQHRQRASGSEAAESEIRRTGLVQLLLCLSSRSDQITLTVLGRVAPLGIYGLASRINDVGTALPGILANAVQPNFVRALDGANRDRLLAKYLARFVGFCGYLGLSVGYVGPFLLRPLLPARYDPALRLLPVLGIGLVGYAFQLYGVLLTRCSRTTEVRSGVAGSVYAAQAVIALAASACGYTAGGLTGLALARTASDTTTYAYIVAHLNREANLTLPRWVPILTVLTIGSTILAVGPGLVPVFGGVSVLATITVVQRIEPGAL